MSVFSCTSIPVTSSSHWPCEEGPVNIILIFRWERNLRVSWHLCFIYSPRTQLPFRTNTCTPSDHTHPPAHPACQAIPPSQRSDCSWPGPGTLPDLGSSLDGTSLHCLPWDWPRSLTPSLGEAAGVLLRGLDRSYQWVGDTPRSFHLIS